MRIGGVEAKGLNECVLVLPRADGDLVFTARAVPDYDEFEKLCPEPVVPAILTKDGKKLDDKDTEYLAAVARREILRIAYLVVKSLEPSNIEWDSVVMDRPNTWPNYKDDFKKAGLSVVEFNRVWGLISEANCLSEDKLEAARSRFLLGQAQARLASSSPNTEPGNSPSGEPVSASA
jgi:hypothetical protein